MKTDDSYLNSKLIDLLQCLIMSVIECSGYECDRNHPDVFIVYEISLSEILKYTQIKIDKQHFWI